MNANLRNFALWVIIVLLLLALFTLFQNPGQRASSQDISFSQLLSEVDQGHVRDVVIQGPEIHGTFTSGSSFQTYAPNDPTLVSRLYNGKVQITAKPQGDNVPWFVSLLVSWLPFIALIGVWIFLSRQMQGGAGKAMGFGKSRAKMLTEAHGRVTFEDVAGVDEAKQDLQEIVEFLRDPGKFQRLGGRIQVGEQGGVLEHPGAEGVDDRHRPGAARLQEARDPQVGVGSQLDRVAEGGVDPAHDVRRGHDVADDPAALPRHRREVLHVAGAERAARGALARSAPRWASMSA